MRLSLCLSAALLLGACIPLDDDTPDDAADAGPDTGDPTDAAGEAFLAAHNAVRAGAKNPVPSPALAPLTWSAQAAFVAQGWANNCAFEHNAQRGNLGENLYATTVASDTPERVVGAWAAEASDYSYSSNTCAAGRVCGHYTQLVWRDTRQVGCASARCTRNSPFSGFSTWYLWVCDYAPPGNFVGERPY
jgi:pathogenesis-related protein 1